MMSALADCVDELEDDTQVRAHWPRDRSVQRSLPPFAITSPCVVPDFLSPLADAGQSVGLLLRGDAGTFCAGASFSIFERASEAELRQAGAAMREVRTCHMCRARYTR
jgi:enoyl-CoA hydratase/carnithine racemase